MNDVRLLSSDGAAQRNGVLSAKGRVLSLFVLFRLQENDYLIVCPDRDAEFLAQELRRFIFRSKLRIELDQATSVHGCWQAEQRELGTAHFAWDARRSLQLGNTATPSADHADNEGADSARWLAEDIVQGIPHIDAAARDQYTPQMLGLHRWRAFSLSKGCYPGQEIVSRTHYLGQQKRDLFRVRATRPLAAGSALMAAQREVGRVLCAGPALDALAVLPVALTDPICTADAEPVSVHAFASASAA